MYAGWRIVRSAADADVPDRWADSPGGGDASTWEQKSDPGRFLRPLGVAVIEPDVVSEPATAVNGAVAVRAPIPHAPNLYLEFEPLRSVGSVPAARAD